MKRQIQTYTFTPGGAGSGTVTFTNFTTIGLDRILLVENVTRGVTIYNPFSPSLLGTVATNVLTLAASTTGQNSADKLYIVYDDSDQDFDTGAGVSPKLAFGLLVPQSGGAAVVPGDGTLGLKTQPSGQTAAAAALTANPVTVGGRAATATPTPVTDGQVVNVMLTKHGKVVAIPSPRELVARQSTTLTSTTSETTIVTAGGAGVFNDLTLLTITNTSTTNTKVTLRSDTASSTNPMVIYIPALSTVGFSVSTPIPQDTANKPWTLQCGTSVASIEVTAHFIKNT